MEKKKLYPVEKFSSIREMLDLARKEAPTTDAFRFKGENGTDIVHVTYPDFVAETEQIGTALAARGICGGAHIACVGENSYRWVCAYVSTLAGDNIFVPIDKELPLHDIFNVIQRSETTVVFCNAKFKALLSEQRSEIPLVTTLIALDAKADEDYAIAYPMLIEEGKKLLAAGDRSYLDRQSGEYDLKMLVYTSGTTGNPKGVMLSEHNLVSCVYYGLQVSTVYDVCLSVLPYHHTYEAVCSLLVSLHHHSTICINESVRAVIQNFKIYQPSYVYLVPALAEMFYKRIWRTAEEKGKAKKMRFALKLSNGLRKIGIDLRKKLFAELHETFGGRLRKIVCGGAPIRPEVNRFFDDIGISLVNGYGITECSPLVSANREECNTYDTSGMHLACIDVRIVDCDENGRGEICIKGDTVMMGYYQDPAQTAAVLIDGWFHTGDFGRLDEAGNLQITGRKKNIIVLKNGKNVYPEEIENYLMTIPYLKEAVVYAVKDEDGYQNALCAEAFLDEAQLAEMKIEQPEQRFREDAFAVLKDLPIYKQIQIVKLRPEEFVKTTSKKIRRDLVG